MRFDICVDDPASSRQPSTAPATQPPRDWPGARRCTTFGETLAELEAWVLLARARAQVEADDARRPAALSR